MGKQKRVDPLLVALAENRSFTWTEPEGGDMASMRGVIKHGQTLVTQIVEPVPRPTVPEMLVQLATAYERVATSQLGVEADIKRFASIVADLCWYAERLGGEQWGKQPRSNKWSFA